MSRSVVPSQIPGSRLWNHPWLHQSSPPIDLRISAGRKIRSSWTKTQTTTNWIYFTLLNRHKYCLPRAGHNGLQLRAHGGQHAVLSAWQGHQHDACLLLPNFHRRDIERGSSLDIWTSLDTGEETILDPPQPQTKFGTTICCLNLINWLHKSNRSGITSRSNESFGK